MDGLRNHKKAVGDRIRGLRGDVSQTAFAERLSISLPTLQRYEYGERMPKGPVLERLSLVSGRSVNWILTGQERDGYSVAEMGAVYDQDETMKRLMTLLRAMRKEEREKVLEYVEFISNRKKEDE